jgi:hypothetical protein
MARKTGEMMDAGGDNYRDGDTLLIHAIPAFYSKAIQMIFSVDLCSPLASLKGQAKSIFRHASS